MTTTLYSPGTPAVARSRTGAGGFARTPYHALGADRAPRIPLWAERRSVYRGAGRTLYLVETTRLTSARRDLDRLRGQGWDVRVEHAAGSRAARISLSHGEFAAAA